MCQSVCAKAVLKEKFTMTILDSVKGTVNTAVDTISSVAQTIVEKNRTNAKLNRLRLVMKSESELMNRAYIALGKIMYDSRKKGAEINDAECEKLLKVIDTSKAKIAKARECYRKIVNSSNDIFYGNPEVAPEVKEDDIVDITVACSNEGDYKSSPFKEEKPVEKQPEAVAEEKAEPEHLTNICDLKAELEAKREEGFSESADSDEADDGEAPHGELF